MTAENNSSPKGEAPARWQTLGQHECASTPIFKVWQKRCRHESDGREGDFYSITCPDWVQAIAVTVAGELILVEQFRFGTEGFGWELPGGVMDAADKGNAIVAAQRELLEETGYAPSAAKVIGQVYPNPAIQSNRTHYVLLEGCTRVAEPSPDTNEELRLQLADWERVEDLLDAGKISHALSVCGLYAYRRFLRTGKPQSLLTDKPQSLPTGRP